MGCQRIAPLNPGKFLGRATLIVGKTSPPFRLVNAETTRIELWTNEPDQATSELDPMNPPEEGTRPEPNVAVPSAASGIDRTAVRSSRWRWILMLAACLLFPILLFALDRVVGWAVPSLGHILLSTPGVAAHYHTSEFDITAHNNALGLRGQDLSVARTPGVTRIVAIGDSFTWGWGVSDAECWPARLQRLLTDRGFRVEVANAGQPGASPLVYAANARRILPVLKPDLVVVGVVQGEDIGQLRYPTPSVASSLNFLRRLRWLYPNLSGLAKQVRAHFNPILDINASWQRQAQAIQHSLSPEERRRYETLDPEVRDQFERGLFNPFQVHLALRHPSSFLEATRSENDTKAQSLMAASLREVADVAAAQASRVIVVSIPYPLYFSKAALASQHRVGFQVSESMVISDIPESTIQQACKQAGLTSFEISPFFRTQASTNSLFFPLDGHLNAAGHQLLAETLAAQLEPTLQAGR